MYKELEILVNYDGEFSDVQLQSEGVLYFLQGWKLHME